MIAFLLGFLLGFATPSPHSASVDSVRITYVGNEGFLIEVGGKKVLIDALYRAGVSGYVVHEPDVRKLLERARSPFDDVDLVLATHYHADHFDPDAVGLHLLSNRNALFVTTNQAAQQMESYQGYRNIRARVIGVFPEEGHARTLEHNGIHVQALNLRHGGEKPVENLGFLLDIGGRRFLHIGDSGANPAELDAYRLDRDSVDFFFVPYWLLLNPKDRETIVSSVNPDIVIPMHLPPKDDPRSYLKDTGGFEGTVSRIKTTLPNAVAFEEPMTTKTFK